MNTNIFDKHELWQRYLTITFDLVAHFLTEIVFLDDIIKGF